MEVLETKTRPKLERPKLYHAILLNDDYTDLMFVVMVIIEFFGKTLDEAQAIAFEAHQKGRSVAGTYTREIAETKIAEAEKAARKNGFPFKMDIEPAE